MCRPASMCVCVCVCVSRWPDERIPALCPSPREAHGPRGTVRTRLRSRAAQLYSSCARAPLRCVASAACMPTRCICHLTYTCSRAASTCVGAAQHQRKGMEAHATHLGGAHLMPVARHATTARAAVCRAGMPMVYPGSCRCPAAGGTSAARACTAHHSRLHAGPTMWPATPRATPTRLCRARVRRQCPPNALAAVCA